MNEAEGWTLRLGEPSQHRRGRPATVTGPTGGVIARGHVTEAGRLTLEQIAHDKPTERELQKVVDRLLASRATPAGNARGAWS